MEWDGRTVDELQDVDNASMSPLFDAAVEATERNP